MLATSLRFAWHPLAICLLFFGFGCLVVLSPALGAGVAALGVGLVLVAKGRFTVKLFVLVLLAVLMGYATMGRGFAHVGVRPFFVGEAALTLGVLALVVTLPTRRLNAVHVLILAFMSWGAFRTLPYIDAYGLDALRDAASWGYALFAIVVSLLLQQQHLRGLITAYRGFVWFLVPWILVLALVWAPLGDSFPRVPGTDVAIPSFKGGDMGVHLAGVAAFILAGFLPASGWARVAQPLLWLTWLMGFAVIAAVNRGGMLAVMVATSTVVFFTRQLRQWVAPTLAGVLLVAVGVTADVSLAEVGRGSEAGREVSVGQLIDNFASTVGESDDKRLSGTRAWRERWWSEIVNYTFGGEYFWLGKGYGINLAEDDGFAGSDPELSDLRSPHNGHLQFLARGGVPGFALWLAVVLAFATTIARSAYRCHKHGKPELLAVHAWIFAYWMAAVVNMSFDVYLEGPQGGIVFWSLVGLGIGVAAIAGETDATSVGPSALARPATGSR